ncbi:MAG: protein kinase [Candidatus Sericytochromatia bacterium]|nr:protein kinase [Candidatus Sericytochromatia bacterium]
MSDAEMENVELTLVADLQPRHRSPKPPANEGSTAAEPVAERRTGPLRYDMLGSVGQGAMGEILLARDQELRRKVAFKQIHTNMATNPKVLQRFLTEAQITAQLDHPNIVPIYSLEATPDGSFGYSMKLIQGKTFKDLIREARSQLDSTGQTDEAHQQRTLLEHFLKVCDAMHYSHKKGVIHRDLKPANIMVGPYNEVYVMDWGIAKIMTRPDEAVDEDVAGLLQPDAHEPEMERTQLGQIMGTPRYMSPQQAAGRNDTLDGRCDQFALGLILFELVTLKPAFTAKGQVELLKKVLKAELEPMTAYAGQPRIPRELQAIVAKATAKRVDDRYASVADMSDDLRRFFRGEAVQARPDTAWQKVLRWVGQHRELTLGLILLLALLSGGGMIWSLLQRQQAMQQAQEHRQKLSRFLLQVGQRAQLIDSRFMAFERLLTQLAGATSNQLSFGQPGKGPTFTHLDFLGPKTQPPDLAPAPAYGVDLSFAHASYKISPGISRAAIQPLMQQLEPLRHVFRQVTLASQSEATAFLPAAAAERLLREEGVPAVWAFMGLEEGLLVNYPGNTGYPPNYDARKRPWYTESLQQRGPRWKSPYIDASGRGFVLPCTLPLYDSQQRFRGVVAMEMTLEYIKQNFLEIKDLPGVKASYLLDAQGRVLVSSLEQNQDFAVGTLVDSARELQPYGRSEILPAIQAQNAGSYEYTEAGQRQVLAYYPLRAVGWTYLVEADTEQLQTTTRPAGEN